MHWFLKKMPLFLILLGLAFPQPALSQAGTGPQPQLVADINTRTSDSARLWCVVKSGGKLYLLANDGQNAITLLESDGTQAGTKTVAAISPQAEGTCETAILGNELFFTAGERFDNYQLWKTDGTAAGTLKLSSLNPGYAGSLLAYGNEVYFVAQSSADFIRSTFPWGPAFILFHSDGTPQGTLPVHDADAKVIQASSLEFVYNGGLFYTYQGFDQNGSFYAHACLVVTAGGSCELAGLPADARPLAVFKGEALTGGTQSLPGLWTWNPVDGGRLLKDGLANVGTFVASGSWMYFLADDGLNGLSWWRTDGIPGGTTERLPHPAWISSLSVSAFPPPLAFGNGGLFFANWQNGDSYWIIQPGSATIAPALPEGMNVLVNRAFANGERIYYSLDDGSLWTSLGPAASVVQLAPASPPGTNPRYMDLVEWNGLVYFCGWDEPHGFELWQTDGTLAGTRMAVDVNRVAGGSFPNDLLFANQRVFLSTHYPERNWNELWVSDGLPGGQATQLADRLDEFYYFPATLASGIFFLRFSVNYEGHLWFTDGSPAGTRQVVDDQGGLPLEDYYPGYSTSLGGKTLYFWANGWKLWKTDGVSGKANLVYSASSPIAELASLGSRVYFLQGDGMNDRACYLYTTDGSAEGTGMVSPDAIFTDYSPQGSSCNNSSFAQANQRLFIAHFTFENGLLLSQTDGTPGGTLRLAGSSGEPLAQISDGMAVVNDTLYVIAKDAQGWGLFKTRGLDAGGIEKVLAFPSATDGDHPGGLLGGKGRHMAFLDSTANPQRVWVSDGTAAGTHELAGGYAAPSDLTFAQAQLFFLAESAPGAGPATGRELWTADTGLSGAALVADLNPGPNGSDPRPAGGWMSGLFASNGTRLYYSATDGQPAGAGVGAELWMLDFATQRVFLPVSRR